MNTIETSQLFVWLHDYLGRQLRVDTSDFMDEELAVLGFDSLELQGMLAALEAQLGRAVDRELLETCVTPRALVEALTSATPITPRAAKLDAASALSDYEAYVNPALGARLRLLQLDKRFVRARGAELVDAEGRVYLDFVSGYGALPFGHNPQTIWSALHEAARDDLPNLVQGSAAEPAGALAKALLDASGGAFSHVTYANSGAETVEAALKLARVVTGRTGVLSTDKGFHGKTLGALSATGNADYQAGFGAPVADFARVAFGDAAAVSGELDRRPGHYAAFIVEPIQGEGGVVVPPDDYLREVAEICRARSVLLIADEIQTGLFRSGAFSTCLAQGVVPDLLLLGKGLGGGLLSIGACLARPHAYSPQFALKHSSTFAGAGLACRVARTSLAELCAQRVRDNVREQGAWLRCELERLCARFPEHIAEVRGRGLMLGLRVHGASGRELGSLPDVLARQGLQLPLWVAYLLNVERLRVAPTLNGSDVLRIQPPLDVTRAQCQRFITGLERCLEVVASEQLALLLRGVLTGQRPAIEARVRPARASLNTKPRPVRRDARRHFGFLVHPLDAADYRHFEPGLETLTTPELARACDAVGELLEPFWMTQVDLVSARGVGATGEFVMVPRTAAQLRAAGEREASQVVARAVELAVERGAELVGLGGYTSIVSRQGALLSPANTLLTTGNAYTAHSGFEAIAQEFGRQRRSLRDSAAVVFGAAGSVAGGAAMLLAERVARLSLLGNPQRTAASQHQRLLEASARICRELRARSPRSLRPGTVAAKLFEQPALPACDAPWQAFLEIATHLDALGVLRVRDDASRALERADVVVLATSATHTLVRAEDLAAHAVVCDLSRPFNVPLTLRDERPDVTLIEGGLIATPSPIDLRRLGLPRDTVYACMAETMLLALDGLHEPWSCDANLRLEQITRVERLARVHGFRVAHAAADGCDEHSLAAAS